MESGAAMPFLKLWGQGLPRKAHAPGHVMPSKPASSHDRGQPGPEGGCPGVCRGQCGWQGMLAAGAGLRSWLRLCRWQTSPGLSVWGQRRILQRTPVGNLQLHYILPQNCLLSLTSVIIYKSVYDTQLNNTCWLNYLEKNYRSLAVKSVKKCMCSENLGKILAC